MLIDKRDQDDKSIVVVIIEWEMQYERQMFFDVTFLDLRIDLIELLFMEDKTVLLCCFAMWF